MVQCTYFILSSVSSFFYGVFINKVLGWSGSSFSEKEITVIPDIFQYILVLHIFSAKLVYAILAGQMCGVSFLVV
jgi:hypothetical protein